MAKAHRMTPARRAALRKAQRESARKRAAVRKKSSKKLSSRWSRFRGLREYKDYKTGRSTGQATITSSRTNWGAMRKAKRAARYNVRYAKKLKRASR